MWGKCRGRTITLDGWPFENRRFSSANVRKEVCCDAAPGHPYVYMERWCKRTIRSLFTKFWLVHWDRGAGLRASVSENPNSLATVGHVDVAARIHDDVGAVGTAGYGFLRSPGFFSRYREE